MKSEDIKDAVILFVVITASIIVAGLVTKKLAQNFEAFENLEA